MNCHMDAMCSARARALVQDLMSVDVENEEKYGKIGEKYRCLWRIHNRFQEQEGRISVYNMLVLLLAGTHSPFIRYILGEVVKIFAKRKQTN